MIQTNNEREAFDLWFKSCMPKTYEQHINDEDIEATRQYHSSWLAWQERAQFTISQNEQQKAVYQILQSPRHEWEEVSKQQYESYGDCGDEGKKRILYTSPPKQAIPEGWKPIETAPKDGSSFDVWLGNCDESSRRFYCSGNTRRSPDWHYKDGKFRPHIALGSMPTFITPTHWMPIPTAPTNTEVGE